MQPNHDRAQFLKSESELLDALLNAYYLPTYHFGHVISGGGAPKIPPKELCSRIDRVLEYRFKNLNEFQKSEAMKRLRYLFGFILELPNEMLYGKIPGKLLPMKRSVRPVKVAASGRIRGCQLLLEEAPAVTSTQKAILSGQQDDWQNALFLWAEVWGRARNDWSETYVRAKIPVALSKNEMRKLKPIRKTSRGALNPVGTFQNKVAVSGQETAAQTENFQAEDWVTIYQVARVMKIPLDSLRKRVERAQQKNEFSKDNYQAFPDKGRNKPKFQYKFHSLKPFVEALKCEKKKP